MIILNTILKPFVKKIYLKPELLTLSWACLVAILLYKSYQKWLKKLILKTEEIGGVLFPQKRLLK